MNKSGQTLSKYKGIRKVGFAISRKEISFAVFVTAGFFIGRVVAFDYMNPAITAYLSVFLGTAATFYITCFAALAGLLTNLNEIALIEYLISFALLGAANYFIIQNRISLTDARKSATGGACILLASTISAAIGGMNFYFMLIGTVECIVTISLTFIFIIAHKTITQTRRAAILSNEQLVSVSVLLGVCFVGMAGIAAEGVYLRDVLSLTAVLVLANAGGAGVGATCGLIFSIIMFAGADYSAAYTGILGVAGIVAGIFSDFGKMGSVAGFIISALIATLYLERSLVDPQFFMTLGVSGLLFLLMPRTLADKIAYCFISDNSFEFEEYAEKLREAASERLKGFSESFRFLSGAFSGLSGKKESMNQKDVSKLIDKIAENACKGCEGFDNCWKNSFYATYQAIFSFLAASDKKGFIVSSDIPESFKGRCTDLNTFTEITNRVFLIYKTDVKWRNRIIESRELVSQQLGGVSEIIDGLSDELKTLMKFDERFENVIREQLEKQRIGVDSVIVLENKNGRYEVDLTTKSDIDMRTLGKNVITTVSEILGRRMMRENAIISGKGVRLKIAEARKFNITAGVARAAKSGSEVSGDNYTWMELKNGRTVAALSDGMGSGPLANEESKATIEILEQFLESGFDKELAIKMINSILILKSDDDFFTTLDLLCIDLYTGICEIVKIGAVETFLLRDGKVRVIRQSGLPAGIMTSIDVETSTLSLKDGDILLVVSDGVTEAARPKDFSWIIETLEEYKSLNPQYIADYIIEQAKTFDSSVRDDMTVMALRVWTKN